MRAAVRSGGSVLGIDPGTSRWGFVFLEGGKVVEEKSIPTPQIKANLNAVVELAKCAQLVVGPSGYGIPLKKVADLTEMDFLEILLKHPGEKTVMGLETVLRAFKEANINAYVLPGVKLLPTVAERKKKNKIDMGTPDKLCAAVAGIVDQSRRLKLHYNETSFILAEIGFGFDAFIAVEGGRIIDGIGGAMSSSTWRGEDGEILYLKGGVGKEELRKGDVAVKKVCAGALRDINMLLEDFKPREILVSGSKSAEVFGFLKTQLKNVVHLNTCKSSNAAYGAAVIADGLAGGEFKDLIGLIGIKEARGGNLDYVRF